jgi:UDP-2,3-diacylglucosamine pyrophosphatase LpxH
MKVVVTSDHHLGYEKSDKASFDAFLETLAKDNDITHFVLLGDVVDMWRRDASGVFLEHRDTFGRILALRNKGIDVQYVAGNHDYHALSLQNHSYPFAFRPELLLEDTASNVTYRFVHGYQFDLEQQEGWMEGLCRVMSDEVGDFESGLWAELTRGWSNPKYVLFEMFQFWKKSGMQKMAARLQQGPEVRFSGVNQYLLNQINKRACASVRQDEVLIFGHTHVPFVNKSGNVANCGSWVKDATPYDTYVELAGGKPHLFMFPRQEITERKEC